MVDATAYYAEQRAKRTRCIENSHKISPRINVFCYETKCHGTHLLKKGQAAPKIRFLQPEDVRQFGQETGSFQRTNTSPRPIEFTKPMKFTKKTYLVGH